jgi:hypothetical protein
MLSAPVMRCAQNLLKALERAEFNTTPVTFMLAGVKQNRTTAALPDHKAGDLLMVAVTVPSPSP